jgi:hypothetical protein
MESPTALATPTETAIPTKTETATPTEMQTPTMTATGTATEENDDEEENPFPDLNPESHIFGAREMLWLIETNSTKEEGDTRLFKGALYWMRPLP